MSKAFTFAYPLGSTPGAAGWRMGEVMGEGWIGSVGERRQVGSFWGGIGWDRSYDFVYMGIELREAGRGERKEGCVSGGGNWLGGRGGRRKRSGALAGWLALSSSRHIVMSVEKCQP